MAEVHRAVVREVAPQTPQLTGLRLAAIAAAAAVLYLAQAVFLPLAIAMLIAFALSPLVSRLRHTGLPMLWTVVAVVTATGLMVALFAFVVFGQLAQLAISIPTYRGNIIEKVEGLKSTGGDGSVFARLSEMAGAVGASLAGIVPQDETGPAPLPVEVVEHTTAFDIATDLLLPLVGPVATAGLVVILVAFMLLERDQLRERFIRLVGSSDLHRTTEVLEEAGSRVGTYLLTQLLVNIIYAVPIALGLWIIGVPNALLWGMLTLVLRFVPYIGSALSAAMPLCLAFAVSPDWGMVIWTGALFLTVEAITSNMIEPYLYGSRTGISPLAVIIAAIFWTFLWGPLGLVLSTPLTVCLVVLGRHIPQFDLFDILFGDSPVLAPHARLYQRLLSGDRMEATFRAEEELDELGLEEFYQASAIPALLLAQDDKRRGVLQPDREQRFAETASGMVADLQAIAEEAEALPERVEVPEDWRFAAVGGRSAIDDCSAEMLAQVLLAKGMMTEARSFSDLAPARIGGVVKGMDCVVLCFLDPAPSRGQLLHIQRIKKLEPHLAVGVVIWDMPAEIRSEAPDFHFPAVVAPAKLAEALEIGAAFAVTSLQAACEACEGLGVVEGKQEPEKRRRVRKAVSEKVAG